MNKKKILVITGSNPANAELQEWANQSGTYEFRFVDTDEEAIEQCHRRSFDLVVANTTDENIGFKKLQAVLPILQSEIMLLDYKGETVSELGQKVDRAFDHRKMERIKRLLILDSSRANTFYNNPWENLPPFSAN